jgi:hypothetical protein
MPKLFHADQFSTTQWATAEQKAQWENALASWVSRGFPQNGFTKSLYERLRNTFGHIAHYNRAGFYGVWFADIHRQLKWLRYVAKGGAYGPIGDAAYTWSDVEAAFSAWVLQSGLMARYEQRCAAAIETSERALLAHLLSKYPQAAAPSATPDQPASDDWEHLFVADPLPAPTPRFRELEPASRHASRKRA